MMKPGILLMVRELHHGGSERQLTELAIGLNGGPFQPHVGAFRVQGIRADELRAAGIPILQLPIRSFKSTAPLSSAWKLAEYVKANNINLVHTFDMPVTAYAIPVVRLLTDAVALASQRCHLSLAGPYLRRSVLFAHRRAHGIVVNCEFLRHHLIAEEGIVPSHVHVCYNGVDLNRFHRQSLTGSAKSPALVIGTVSVLRPEKGLNTLVDAFAAVQSTVPSLQLKIVGSGPQLPELQAQAQRLGVANSCVFTPSTDRVEECLNRMDVFVLPSLNEALSNSLLEAMACGCACIASRVGGNIELVDDGGRGLLFERGNSGDLACKLQALLSSPALRSQMAATAHDFVHAEFSRERSVGRMTDIYEEVIAAIANH